MKIAVVFGTRPEIIKMAPIIHELKRADMNHVLVHTGQHYDYNLSMRFIHELGISKPHYSLKLESDYPTTEIGEIIIKLHKVLKEAKADIVLAEGDTNSVVAAALTALKMGLRIGHVEAGLRSFDWRMPEEHNRIVVDHISNMLFAPTRTAEENLVKERVRGKIFVTGNTVIDAVTNYMPLAEKKSRIMEFVKFKEYALMTAHRAENVDDPDVLRNFVEVCLKSPIPIIFPVHPRTAKRLRQFGLYKKLTSSPNVQLLSPIPYFDFLVLMKNCRLILTDSGGIQEEATAPTIRKNGISYASIY